MNINAINSSIRPQKELLLQHSLYNKVKTIDDVRHFLEGYAYAVWDFMSLLKALQAKLTCVSTPWLPVGNPELRYLIDEIVLAGEAGINSEGKRQSRYEMYIDAMKACGADASGMEAFLEDVESTQNIFVSIKRSGLHQDLKAFLDFTFRTIEHGKPHQIAAAFTFGRESLIPPSFIGTLKSIQAASPEISMEKLIHYFETQPGTDNRVQCPMAIEMVTSLCGNDAQKWKEAEETALLALEKRLAFWNAIEEDLLKHDMASI